MTFGRAFLMLACLFVPFPGAFVLMALAVSSKHPDTRTLACALLSALALLVLLLVALRLSAGPSIGHTESSPKLQVSSAQIREPFPRCLAHGPALARSTPRSVVPST